MSKRVVFTPPLSAFFFSFLSLASFFLIALVLLVSSSHRPTEVRTEHLDFGCRAVLVFVLVFVDCECSLGVFEWVFNICLAVYSCITTRALLTSRRRLCSERWVDQIKPGQGALSLQLPALVLPPLLHHPLPPDPLLHPTPLGPLLHLTPVGPLQTLLHPAPVGPLL